MEIILETKICTHCQAPFDITDRDLAFYDKISPTFGGKKYSIPTPTLCPDCRAQRRLAFRNERKLYKRKCDITGKEIISMYHPQSEYKVCDRHVWRSDQWDPMKYGRVFDPSQSFFAQFEKLWKEVPNVSLYNVNTTNSEYTNHCLNEKNCYMIFGSYENEDCLYGEGMGRCKDCMDLLRGTYLDACYECVDTKSSYKIFRGQKCNDCSESYFLYNCSNCHHCFGCVNLVNQSYCIENIPYTKEEYLAKLATYDLQNYEWIQDYKHKFAQMVKTSIHKFADFIHCEEVTGDNLESVKNSFYCFDMKDARDCKYCTHVMEMNDVYDAYGAGAKASLIYEIVDTGLDESRVAFTIVVYQSTNAYYSVNCHGCHNIFGCIGLRNKEYCILNKQYTKEAYEELVPQIIQKMRAPSSAGKTDGERGEFFHQSMSPFGYNESITNDHFPDTRENLSKKGFKRCDYEAPFPKTDVDNVIICEVTGKPFRLIRQELEFYHKYHLPLPRKHPDQRHLERTKLRNPKKLRDRTCNNCGITIKTSYSPDRPEKVYCEQCYNHEVYG